MLRPRNPLYIHRTTLYYPAYRDQVLARRVPYMYRKIQNRGKGNKSVEAKGSEGGVGFPGVDEGGAGGRAGEGGDMLSRGVSEIL